MSKESTEDDDAVVEVPPQRRGHRRAVLITGALLAAAMVFAGWTGVLWWQAAHDDGLAYVADRQSVLDTGYRDIALLTSLDFRQPDAGLRRWADATTGSLHEQLQQANQPTKQQIAAAKTVTTGTVVDAAVTELDTRAGSARMIASVQVVVTPVTGKPVTKRNRLQAELTRTDGGWKLSDLRQVPMGGA